MPIFKWNGNTRISHTCKPFSMFTQKGRFLEFAIGRRKLDIKIARFINFVKIPLSLGKSLDNRKWEGLHV